MKIQMLCFYQDYVQGDIYDLEKAEAEKLIGNKLAQKYGGTDVKKSPDESLYRNQSKNVRWKTV